MTKKPMLKLLLAAAALLLMLAPMMTAQARSSGIRATTTTLGNFNGTPVTYNTNTNGCDGTLIGVFGSSAVKSFVLQAAIDYCNQYKAAHGGNGSGGPDVEYAISPAGDSCPGVDYAADNSDANEIGASDVFAPACTGALARAASKINDTNLGPNIVDAIAQCPGANDVQGGSVHPLSPDVQCQGSAATAGTCASIPTLQFPAPDNLSQLGGRLLWSSAAGDWSQVGGCLGFTPFLQERVTGSGTRATYCLNIFGPGVDLCANTATAPAADTTGTMVKDVCGNSTTGAGPVDGFGTIGYVARTAVVKNPNQPAGVTNAPLAGCGLVQLGGKDGYNRNCDPGQVTMGNPQPYTGVNAQSGATTCKGDLQVVDGEYAVWGYEHFDVNQVSGNNAAAKAFITFALGDDITFQSLGFMRNCQMQVSRGIDGGPYVATAGASC